MRLSLLLICFMATQVLLAQTFTEMPPASDFEGVSLGSIAFADIDGDNDNDVMITGLDSSSEPIAKLYTNDGTGSFTEVTGTPFEGVYDNSIAFSDVDGDGDNDLLITGLNEPTRIAKLYTNNGAGSFNEVMGTPFEGVSSGSIAFEDVDGDGDSDLLITGFGDSGSRIVKLYTNDGPGSFSEVMGTPFEAVSSGSIAFADVDGDGDSDVMITGRIGGLEGIAKLYTNDGTGSFTEVMDTPFEGVFFSSIAFSDVDDDGDSDVMITGDKELFQGITKLYTNDGMGGFTEMINTPFDSVYKGSIAFSDVDGDGDSDVMITGDNDSGRIAKLYTGDGTGSFTEVTGTNFDAVNDSYIAFSDVDGDGDSDLLITGRNSSFERIANLYTNDGAGDFPVVLPPPFKDVNASTIAFSDVDGDGDGDLLMTGFGDSGRIANLYTNDGTGVFTEVIGTPFEGVNASSIAFSDVDGDGDSDLLITGLSDSGRIAKLYTNDGTGSYTEVIGTPFVGVSVSYVAFSDVDGDGDNDLLIAGAPSPGPEIVKLYTNDGTGNFTEVTDTPFDNLQVDSFAFSDVDGDGDSDLIMLGRNNTGPPFALFARLYTNDGTGNFTEVMGTPFTGVDTSALAFSDVDGDGDSDVLIAGSTSPGIEQATKLYTNDGMGNFTEVMDTPFIGVVSGSIAFADVDNDGDRDVLVTGRNGPTLQSINTAILYTNDGTGGYTEVLGTPFVGVAGLRSIAFSDIDGDGDSDVLITGQNNESNHIAKLYTNDGIVTSVVNNPQTLNFDFEVYPNPTTASQLNIHYQSNENSLMNVKVFDLNGRQLMWWQRRSIIGRHTFSINITSLVQGIYFVELDNGKKRGVAKIIVQ